MEEAHPIPQNVTSFEFKLVGDMTLKQFLYLATGAGIAYLIFILLAVSAPIIAWPIIIVSAGLGIAFAFLPLADRPLDHWVKAYFKAVYSPTKRVWKKGNQVYSIQPLFWQRMNLYLQKNFASYQIPILPVTIPQIPKIPQPIVPTQVKKEEPLPSKEELEKTVALAKDAQSLQVKIIEIERQLAGLKNQASQPGVDSQVFAPQITQLIEHLQQLMSQAAQTREQLKPQRAESPKVTVVQAKPIANTVTLTSTPNVVSGIVIDPSGNYLEGAVVVIYDKEGLPVRALKTNKLGQFTGSTPLPSGIYTIETEKEQFSFDVLQIELSNAVLSPLQVTAKV